MSHQRILDHTGRQLADIELAQMWGGVGPCVGIARGELHRVLLESNVGVRVRLGTSVTGLSQHDDKVHVVFTDGSTACMTSSSAPTGSIGRSTAHLATSLRGILAR